MTSSPSLFPWTEKILLSLLSIFGIYLSYHCHFWNQERQMCITAVKLHRSGLSLLAALDTADMSTRQFLHLTSKFFFPEQLWPSLFALLQQSTTNWTLRNNRYGSLTVLEFGKFKSKTQVWSVSSKGPTGRTVAFWSLLWENSFFPWNFLFSYYLVVTGALSSQHLCTQVISSNFMV